MKVRLGLLVVWQLLMLEQVDILYSLLVKIASILFQKELILYI